MRCSTLPFVITTCVCLAACNGDDGSTDAAGTEVTETTAGPTSDAESTTETGDESTTETGGESTTETGGEAVNSGLPEGVSTWTGEAEINGIRLLLDATITNTGGDLTVSVTLKDHPDEPAGLGTGQYTLTGTHEPSAGLVALAPDSWTTEPDILIELVGLSGTYNPDTKVLSGVLVDYATGDENFLTGGSATLELVDGAGAPTAAGDMAAALTDGSQTFSGTMACSGPAREVEGTLVYDGAGGLTGSIKLGDPDFATPLGSFAVTGVHNPSTGGITLVPGLWEEWNDSKLTFFVDGTLDPETGEFDGDVGTNSAACPSATWQTAFE